MFLTAVIVNFVDFHSIKFPVFTRLTVTENGTSFPAIFNMNPNLWPGFHPESSSGLPHTRVHTSAHSGQRAASLITFQTRSTGASTSTLEDI